MRALIAATAALLVLAAVGTAGAQTPPGVEEVVTTGEEGSFGCGAAQASPSFTEAQAASLCIGSTQCKWTKSQATYRSLLGFVIYRYWQRQSFCYTGNTGKITKLYDYSRGDSNVDQSWDFVGHEGPPVRTGGVGTGGATVRTDGHFKQCVTVIISCYHRYPWVITRMDNSGAVIFGGHN